MAWDNLLTFIETGISASKNGNAIQVNNVGKMEIDIRVKKISGVSPVLVIEVQESEDGTNFKKVAQFNSITAIGNHSEYFKADKKFIRYALNITHSGTSTDPLPSIDVEFRLR